VAADELLDRHIERAGSGVSGFAILAAVTLDGIPENTALGVSLLVGGASLLSPSWSPTCPRLWAVGMRDQDRTPGFVVLVWVVTDLLLTVSVVAGDGALSGRARGCSLSSSPSPAGQGSCSRS